MPFEIPDNLHPDVMGVAWLLGRWEGSGKSSYPDTEDIDFGQQIDFAQNGGNYLHYLSQTFTVDADGRPLAPLSMETGFWLPKVDGTVEVVLSQPAGYAEVWYGKVTGARIELATDVVMRTASAPEYTAGQRLYGNVEGDLLYAYDMAAMGQALQPHLWARLQRA